MKSLYNVVRILSLILTINLLSTINVFAQSYQPDTLVWQGAAKDAYIQLLQGNYKKAEQMFQELTSTREFRYWGYYGLGLVALTQDSTSEKAFDNFSTVIRMPNNISRKNRHIIARSEYAKGQMALYAGDSTEAYERWSRAVYENEDCLVAWLGLAKLELTYKFPTEFGPDIFHNIFRLGNFNQTYYQTFVDAALWYQRNPLGIETLEPLYFKRKRPKDFLFDILTFHYRVGNYKKSLDWIDTLQMRDKSFSQSILNQIRAKNYFQLDDPKAYVIYNRGLQLLSDSVDASYLFNDVYYIMTNEEYGELQKTSVRDLYNYYKRFWLKRDPNHATEINERISEHYKRLAHARNHYRRFAREYTKAEAADDLMHPMWSYASNISGEKLLNKYLPSVFTLTRDLDDMGIIYLKHGEPDYTTTAPLPSLEAPENMSWQYYAKLGHREMIFHFGRYSGFRGWKLQLLPYTFRFRGQLGQNYHLFDPELEGAYRGDDPSNEKYLEEMADSTEKDFEFAAKNESTEYEFEEDEFTPKIDLLNFKGEDGYSRVNLFYGLEGKTFSLNSDNQINYMQFIGVYDTLFNEIINSKTDKKLKLNVNNEVWQNSSIMRLEKMDLKPDPYNIEIQIKDLVSNKIGVFKGKYVVPNYFTNKLMMSSIILSNPISGEPGSKLFKRNGVSYSPHMFKAYNGDYELGLYFEVYNIGMEKKNSRFDISLILKLRNDDRAPKSFDLAVLNDFDDEEYIKMTNEYTGASQDDFIYMNIDIESLDEGIYDLFIRVEDKINETTADQKTMFTIFKE